MNRQHVIDHDLVGRYLRGELDADEREAFEIFYLDDPETLDELEALASVAEKLGSDGGTNEAEAHAPVEADRREPATGRGGPEADPEKDAAGSPSREHPSQRRATIQPQSRRRRTRWGWPLATAAALVVGLATGIATGPFRSPAAQPGLQAATVVHIELMRSSEQPIFEIPTDAGAVLLKVAVGSAESAYRVTLTGDGGQTLASEALVPDVYGDVGVLVQAASLPKGPLKLQVIGLDSGQSAMTADLLHGSLPAPMD